MSVLFSPAYIKELTNWRRNRIKNYSIRKGVSFEKVIAMLLNEVTVDDMVNELDCICDPEFHSSQKPQCIIKKNKVVQIMNY